jgi:hypothetical protein
MPFKFVFIFFFLHVQKISKSKAVPLHHAGAKGERRYSSYSLLISELDGVSGQDHTRAELYPWGKDTQYTLDRRLGGPQSQSGHRE